MAVSRPILLALVGAVLALTAFFATSGARNSDDGATVVTPAEPAGKASSAGKALTPAKAKPTSATSTGDELAVPAAVRRALARDRTVVLFFRQRGADDDATAEAVAGVRGRRGAAVFSAPISRLSDYSALTAEIGISQAPAVVIVGKSGKARLIEGFIDEETLKQEVADSR